MNEDTRTEETHPALTALMIAAVLLALGGAGYLFFTYAHEIGMIMLGNMVQGYERFLLHGGLH